MNIFFVVRRNLSFLVGLLSLGLVGNLANAVSLAPPTSEVTPKSYDLCLFGAHQQDIEERYNHFVKLESKDLTAGVVFSQNEKDIIMWYLQNRGYNEGQAKTWELVEKNFFDVYEEWSLTYYKDLYTSTVYIYFGGFPGENQSGGFFDTTTLEILADVGDGGIYDCKAKFTSFDNLRVYIPEFEQIKKPNYGGYACYFGRDLLDLMRMARFEFDPIRVVGGVVRNSTFFYDKKYGDKYLFVMREEPRRGGVTAHVAYIQSTVPPYFKMAEYRNGQVTSCVEAEDEI